MSQDAVQRTDQNGPDASNLHSNQVRRLDPNVAQRKASDPDASVWVSASAGTGKTKVLTDRILRLMLPRADGQPGTPPQRILAITFTKAGAGEMRQRINAALSGWTVMPPEQLQPLIGKLLGRAPVPADIDAARRLFAQVVDVPGGLKIMTIHAFCQSVLSRFPLEAGLPPYFTVLEEAEASSLLSRAQNTVLERAQAEKTTPEGLALARVAQAVNEEQFQALLADITAERAQLEHLLVQHFGVEGLYSTTCAALGVTAGTTPEQHLLAACADAAFNHQELQHAITVLLDSASKTDKESGQKIAAWLEKRAPERAAFFETYRSVFFTGSGEFRKNFTTQVVARSAPKVLEEMAQEAERLRTLQDTINTASCALLTRDLLILGRAIAKLYQEKKSAAAALDFDDLIFTTLALLEGRTSTQNTETATSWVLYKLDQGIDHVLIDEAQDTNPEQWQIIKALCDDFFAGTGAREQSRTIFVVGDEKQSIYSFQRASPKEFARMRDEFEQRIREANGRFEDIQMNISFRSAKSVLKAVDATFAQPGMKAGMGTKDIGHEAFHGGRGGRVELWPLCESPKSDNEDYWTPPLSVVESSTGAALLAKQIADRIKSWLENGEILPSKGRPINPGDILILVRTRTAFFGQLSKALKSNNIPVSGIDRMVASEQLAVQDLMAAAAFALMPGDDLTLACLLKSPLVGMTEDQLYTLAIDRADKESLWEVLPAGPIRAWLQNLTIQARKLHPFEFFSALLQRPCPADNVSGLRAIRSRLGTEAIDPIDEFMEQALQYERRNLPSLQSFLHHQERERHEAKREMGEHSGEVRIMTVHGAKGLEAPIIIMPDTVRTTRTVPSQAGRRLLWPDKTGLPFPLWSPRTSFDFPLYKEAARTLDERADEEYKRLLYVAMTRASDRLYVCGHKGSKNLLPTSWYNFIRDGLLSLPETETLKDDTLVLENQQTQKAESKEHIYIPNGMQPDLPLWLYEQAPDEKGFKSTSPSNLEKTDRTVFLLASHRATYSLRQGVLMHKLLEFLPGLAPERIEAALEDFLRLYAQDLPVDIRSGIGRKTLALLGQPEFAPIFGPGSQAEVPLTGRMADGRIITGQIDRLLITESEIWIVDYKTGQSGLTDTEIPSAYRKQIQAYTDTLRSIYPGRHIRADLLWTDEPRFTRVDVD